VDAGEETVADGVVSAEEGVVTEEDEEDFQEVVDEVSLTSPRRFKTQEIEYSSRGTPYLCTRASDMRPRVADRRVRRSRR
jgi:hypothetical protein